MLVFLIMVKGYAFHGVLFIHLNSSAKVQNKTAVHNTFPKNFVLKYVELTFGLRRKRMSHSFKKRLPLMRTVSTTLRTASSLLTDAQYAPYGLMTSI